MFCETNSTIVVTVWEYFHETNAKMLVVCKDLEFPSLNFAVIRIISFLFTALAMYSASSEWIHYYQRQIIWKKNSFRKIFQFFLGWGWVGGVNPIFLDYWIFYYLQNPLDRLRSCTSRRYLIDKTTVHISTQIHVARRVNKHDSECIVEVTQWRPVVIYCHTWCKADSLPRPVGHSCKHTVNFKVVSGETLQVV